MKEGIEPSSVMDAASEENPLMEYDPFESATEGATERAGKCPGLVRLSEAAERKPY